MNETQIRRRNYLALITEGCFFTTGLAFIDVNAVIPVFIFTYTNSLKFAGLATTINLAAAIVTQILIGPYVKSIRHMPAYIARLMFLFRPLPLLMIPVLLSNLSPTFTVIIFLAIYTLLFSGQGLILVPWMDLFGRTILPGKRGAAFGYQQLFGGIGSLAAGFAVKSVLEHTGITDATRYAIIFGCAATSMILAAVVMLFTRDLPRPVSAMPENHLSYYARLPAYLKKNQDFRRLAVIRVLTGVTGMITPFLILFGRSIFGLDMAQVSTLIYIQIAGSLTGSFLWRFVSSRFGNKQVILLAQIIGLIIPVFALACFLVKDLSMPWQLLWPLILANGVNMGSWAGIINYTIDIVDEQERTVYLLLSNIMTFPLTVLAFLAGIIADLTGFVPLFAASGATAFAGICLARRLKP